MWSVDGARREVAPVPLDIVTVLYEFDGPRIFTCRLNEALHLALQLGEDRGRMRFLLAPTNRHVVDELTRGASDVRSALAADSVRVIDVNYSWVPASLWVTQLARLPAGVLPKPGVMLYPEHAPVIRSYTARPASFEQRVSFKFPAPLTHCR